MDATTAIAKAASNTQSQAYATNPFTKEPSVFKAIPGGAVHGGELPVSKIVIVRCPPLSPCSSPPIKQLTIMVSCSTGFFFTLFDVDVASLAHAAAPCWCVCVSACVRACLQVCVSVCVGMCL